MLRAIGPLVGSSAPRLSVTTTEVSKRIDVFASAIHHGMSVEEVSEFDLSYTPPLSSPWDPVQIATQAWTSGRNARTA